VTEAMVRPVLLEAHALLPTPEGIGAVQVSDSSAPVAARLTCTQCRCMCCCVIFCVFCSVTV
jgi:hypothetical protein